MDMAKIKELLMQYFPFSYQAKADIIALVINVLIYIIAALVTGLVLGLIGKILPFAVIGWLLGIVGGVIELYILIGIVLSALDYFKILK